MRAKNVKSNTNYNPIKFTFNSNVQKRTQEVKRSSNLVKKAREIFKQNLHIMRGGFSNQLRLLDENSDANTQRKQLPLNEEEDAETHQTLAEALTRQYALHLSTSWNTSFKFQQAPPVDRAPRSWKEATHPFYRDSFCLTKNQLQFQELIYEIILSEQSYLDDLILTYKVFVKDSIDWTGLPNSVKLLFEQIKQIISIHAQLLQDLKSRQASNKVVHTITDIFMSFVPQFQVYSDFFANFSKATNAISESIKQQNELGLFMIRRQSWTECRNLPITAYLLTPIQRIMRYPLFFKSLEECLEENDDRAVYLRFLAIGIDSMLRDFEQQQRDAEDLEKLENLELRIKPSSESEVPNLAVPGRKLIYEGFLGIVQSTQPSNASMNGSLVSLSTPTLLRRSSTFSIAPKKDRLAYVFLFNDMIILTRISKQKLQKKSAIRAKKGSFYGPSPTTMFKMVHVPGKLTFLGASSNNTLNTMPEENHDSKPEKTPGKKENRYFRFFKRPAKCNKQQISPTPSPDNTTPNDFAYILPSTQFHCTLATQDKLVSVYFEAETEQVKQIWCHHIETTLSGQACEDTPENTGIPIPLKANFDDSIYSSSCESEQETFMEMEDNNDDIFASINNDMNMKENEDIVNSIMDAFSHSVWTVDEPALSSVQLNTMFDNILPSKR